MKKVFFYLLFSFLLTLEAAAQVPTWSAEIINTIAKLQPKFQTTSTKFKKLAVEKSGIGGDPANRLCDNACPDLQSLGREAYIKTIILSQAGYHKKIEVDLEVYVTDSPEQAKTLLESIRQLRGLTGTDCCPQYLIAYVPISFFIYGNTVVTLMADANRNAKLFRKYADAFEADLKKQL